MRQHLITQRIYSAETKIKAGSIINHIQALPEGYLLQEYKITGTLGFGGFGITYSAIDTHLEKLVAIKEYLPATLAVRIDGSTISAKSEEDKESFNWGLDRFLDEARVVARFDHRNIVKIYRFFEQNGTGYIVMEFIDGKTLLELQKEKGSLQETEIREWLWPVMEGLKVVHKAGFLHRDIKPHNIMMRRDGRPCLLDFGAARMAIGGRTQSLTAIMTPGFAPLEQYETRGNQGPWTDIYALGAVMYGCVSGRKPKDALDRIRNDALESPESGTAKTYSKSFLEGIMTALSMQEVSRPQSLEALLDILDSPKEEHTLNMPGVTPSSDSEEVAQEQVVTQAAKLNTDDEFESEATVTVGQPPEKQKLYARKSQSMHELPKKNGSAVWKKVFKGAGLAALSLLILLILLIAFNVYKSDEKVVMPGEDRQSEASEKPSEGLVKESSNAAIDVTSDPSGARVYIHQKFAGVTPFTFNQLMYGETADFRFEHAGYDPNYLSVTAGVGTERAFLRLQETVNKAAGAIGPDDYTLTVNTVPGDAFVDIANTKTQFESGMPVGNGSYWVVVSKEGYFTQLQWAEVLDMNRTIWIELVKKPANTLGTKKQTEACEKSPEQHDPYVWLRDSNLRMEDIYGDWEIFSLKKFGTTIRSLSTVEERIGEIVSFHPNGCMSDSKHGVRSVRFELRTTFKPEKGVILNPSDRLTGLIPNDRDVTKLLVRARREKTIYTEFEIISETEMILPTMGYGYYLRKQANPLKSAYMLQVGAYRSGEDARQQKQLLAQIGVTADIEEVNVNGISWHRVRIGPIVSARQASEIRQQLLDNKIESLVLEVDSTPTAKASLAPAVADSVFKDCENCPEMVVIPAGKFQMGHPSSERRSKYGYAETPVHQVNISQFAIGKYEVTFEEYDIFADATGRDRPKDGGWRRWGRGSRPVIKVSWDDANAYVKWLSMHTGKYYRLPSESEWEYAARAGTTTSYWWGDDIGGDNANCDGCGSSWDNKKTAPVGSFNANPFGLFDVHGNVWEWVEDCGHEYYDGAPTDGSAWVKDGDCDRRVVRGGAAFNKPVELRSTGRYKSDSGHSNKGMGFRVAQDFTASVDTGSAFPKLQKTVLDKEPGHRWGMNKQSDGCEKSAQQNAPDLQLRESDLKKLEKVYGDWEIFDIKELGYSVVARRDAEKRIGERVSFHPDGCLSYFEFTNRRVVWDFYTFGPLEEGEVLSRRFHVTVVNPYDGEVTKIFVRSSQGNLVYTAFEIISETEMFMVFPGWGYYLRKD